MTHPGIKIQDPIYIWISTNRWYLVVLIYQIWRSRDQD